MKIEITNQEVRALIEAINQLPGISKQLPTKFLYAINKCRGKLKGPNDDVEATRLDLVNKWGKKDKKSGVSKVPPESMNAFQKAYTDVLKEKVTIDFHQYPYEQFEKEVPSLQGVDNIYLIFDYILSEPEGDKPSKNGQKKEKTNEPADKSAD